MIRILGGAAMATDTANSRPGGTGLFDAIAVARELTIALMLAACASTLPPQPAALPESLRVPGEGSRAGGVRVGAQGARSGVVRSERREDRPASCRPDLGDRRW